MKEAIIRKKIMPQAQNRSRTSKYPIQPFFLSRVSSRAFSEERLTEDELMSLFEAAHFAPSSYNAQPWRFIYARRGEKEWDTLFSVLVDFNKSWAKKADTLVLVISRNKFEHNEKPGVTHTFDAGAAWMSLAIEAHLRNIVTHGMQGFDYEEIRKKLSIPENYTVDAMIAIGKPGKFEDLSPELQEKEIISDRKPVEQVISKGKFIFK